MCWHAMQGHPLADRRPYFLPSTRAALKIPQSTKESLPTSTTRRFQDTAGHWTATNCGWRTLRGATQHAVCSKNIQKIYLLGKTCFGVQQFHCVIGCNRKLPSVYERACAQFWPNLYFWSKPLSLFFFGDLADVASKEALGEVPNRSQRRWYRSSATQCKCAPSHGGGLCPCNI